MNIEFELKNYRCFQDLRPARFHLRDGFTSFIGVNNSGKSTLLKFFHEFRGVFRQLAAPQGWIGFQDSAFTFENIPDDNDDIFCNLNNRNLEIGITFHDVTSITVDNNIPQPTRLIITVIRTRRWNIRLFARESEIFASNGAVQAAGTVINIDDGPAFDVKHLCPFFSCLSQILYVGPFRNAVSILPEAYAISLPSAASYFNIRISYEFMQLWYQYKSGTSKKHREMTLRVTDDIRHILKFQSVEIDAPQKPSGEIRVAIDGKSYLLSEVGAGLAELIVIFGNAAFASPTFILIDEPELHLHPSLQLDFLASLGSYASEGVCFATHNIGLARASSAYIYSVRKSREKFAEVVEFDALHQTSLAEFLGELNFSGYRELGFNRILLVEGTTDVLAIQQILRKYGKEHEIVILPMEGGAFIRPSVEPQLEEIKRITTDIFALIDSERNAKGDPLDPNRQGFVSSCLNVGIACHVLELRAIENYFTTSAIQQIKGPKYTALQSYERLGQAANPWAKSENWRIAREMSLQELEATDLGEFLRARLFGNKRGRSH